jgi:peroxiredoxin Q/BCP
MKRILLSMGVLIAITLCFGDDMLAVGSKAPEFTLQSNNKDTVTLSAFKGQHYVVLIFYPGDQTPVCTQQLCEIRDDYSKFEKRGAVVFGINPGSEASHQNFINKHSFQFKLLIDNKGAVAKSYKTKGSLMNQRTVYVINKEGTIVFAQRGKPSVETILQSIPVE